MTRQLKQEYTIIDKASGNITKATKKVKDELDKVEKKSSGVTRLMTSSWSKLAGVIGGAAIINSMKNVAMNTLSYGDTLHKLSLRLGTSAEGLDKLRQVGDLAGVQFETLAMGLQRMTRRLAEASNDTGEARDAIKELGINVDELMGMRPEEQFKVIANRLNAVQDSGKKAALAMRFFDSEGVALLQMMPNLNSELNKTQSSFSAETVAKIAAFNDEISLMKDRFIQTSAAIMEKTLPALTSFLEFLNRGTKETAITQLETKIKLLQSSLDELDNSWNKLLTKKRRAVILQQLEEAKIKLEELKNVAIDNALHDFFDSIDNGAQSLIKLNEEVANFIDSVDEGYDIDTFDDIQRMIDEITTKRNNENIALQRSIDLQNRMTKAVKDTYDDYGKWSDGIGTVTEEQELLEDNMKRGAKYLSDEFTNSFMSLIDGTKSFGEAFTDMIAKIMLDTARAIIQQQILKAVMSSSSSSIGGAVVSAVGSTAGGGTTPSAKGNVFQGGEVTAFASGGIVNRPTLFPMKNGMGLMGEAGYEAVLPLKRGKGGKLGVEGGGGMNITNNITFEGGSNGSEEDQRQLVNYLSRAIEERIKASIVNDMRPGGNMNRTSRYLVR